MRNKFDDHSSLFCSSSLHVSNCEISRKINIMTMNSRNKISLLYFRMMSVLELVHTTVHATLRKCDYIKTWPLSYLTVAISWILGSEKPKSERCLTLATLDLILQWLQVFQKISHKMSKRVYKVIISLSLINSQLRSVFH